VTLFGAFVAAYALVIAIALGIRTFVEVAR